MKNWRGKKEKEKIDLKITKPYMNKQTVARFKTFIDLIENKMGKLLDIGCGPAGVGLFANMLSDNYDYCGLDQTLTTEMIKIAKEKKLKIICADLNQELPFKSKSFDIVTASEVIEHLPNACNVLKEIYRVLKDNGIFIGSVPNACNIYEIWRALTVKREGWGGHLYFFSQSTLELLLRTGGFKRVEFTGTVLIPTDRVFPIVKLLGRKFPKFAQSIVFKAKKE